MDVLKLCDMCDCVKVYAANAGPFLHRCIRYETADRAVSTGTSVTTAAGSATPESTTDRHEAAISALVIGLIVGLGVLLILLIIVVVVYLCKRRDRKKRVANDAVQMSSLSAEHRAER